MIDFREIETVRINCTNPLCSGHIIEMPENLLGAKIFRARANACGGAAAGEPIEVFVHYRLDRGDVVPLSSIPEELHDAEMDDIVRLKAITELEPPEAIVRLLAMLEEKHAESPFIKYLQDIVEEERWKDGPYG